jgi:hypothetical protein
MIAQLVSGFPQLSSFWHISLTSFLDFSVTGATGRPRLKQAVDRTDSGESSSTHQEVQCIRCRHHHLHRVALRLFVYFPWLRDPCIDGDLNARLADFFFPVSTTSYHCKPTTAQYS